MRKPILDDSGAVVGYAKKTHNWMLWVASIPVVIGIILFIVDNADAWWCRWKQIHGKWYCIS